VGTPETGTCISAGSASIQRDKNPLVADVAIARELASWCWSLVTLE